MGNIITIDVTETEHKEPKPNKYNITDIRIELYEQFIILLSMLLLKYRFAFTVWLIVFILTAIKTYKVWKGKSNDSI